jgi:hypothetical protein
LNDWSNPKMVITRNLPQAGERYYHYRQMQGESEPYTILGITSAIAEIPVNIPISYRIPVRHTEENFELEIYHFGDQIFAAEADTDRAIAEPLVLYWKSPLAIWIWARPLDSFLAVLGQGLTHYYRFTQVPEAVHAGLAN